MSAEPPPEAYSDGEVQALDLARELSERVHREREVVRRLRAYLADSATPEPPAES